MKPFKLEKKVRFNDIEVGEVFASLDKNHKNQLMVLFKLNEKRLLVLEHTGYRIIECTGCKPKGVIFELFDTCYKLPKHIQRWWLNE